MSDVSERLEETTRRTAAAAQQKASPFEACQKMRSKKVCPGYIYYPETDTEAFFCSDHCACWLRIRDTMLAATAR